MTKEEALKDMQERCRICKRDALPTKKECANCYFPVAIDCIDRRIPKRAIHTRDVNFIYWNVPVYRCSLCGEEIRFVLNEMMYCSQCGQALKCEGEDDDIKSI